MIVLNDWTATILEYRLLYVKRSSLRLCICPLGEVQCTGIYEFCDVVTLYCGQSDFYMAKFTTLMPVSVLILRKYLFHAVGLK